MGTVGCKPQHFVGVNSKLNFSLCLTFGQITRMTFQHGSCGWPAGGGAAANPSCCDHPPAQRDCKAHSPPLSPKCSAPAGGAGQPPEDGGPVPARPALLCSALLCVGFRPAPKDLAHLPHAHPGPGPQPSPASENCLGKLTR